MFALTSLARLAGKKALDWGKRELISRLTRGKVRRSTKKPARWRNLAIITSLALVGVVLFMQLAMMSAAVSSVAAGQKLLSFVPDYSIDEAGLSDQDKEELARIWESEDFAQDTADTFTCLTSENGSIESVLYDSYAQITHLPENSLTADEMTAWLLYRAGEITARAATVYAIPELRSTNDHPYTAEDLANMNRPTYDLLEFLSHYHQFAQPLGTDPVDTLTEMFPENGGRWSFSQYMPQARALVLREATKRPSVLRDAESAQSRLIEDSLAQCEQFNADIQQGIEAHRQ